jgi:hypothetical protein
MIQFLVYGWLVLSGVRFPDPPAKSAAEIFGINAIFHSVRPHSQTARANYGYRVRREFHGLRGGCAVFQVVKRVPLEVIALFSRGSGYTGAKGNE